MKKYLYAISLCFFMGLLTSCDKGKKSYDVISSTAEKYTSQEVGINNIANFFAAAELYRSHYRQFKDTSSGAKSLEQLKSIKQKIAVYKNSLDTQKQAADIAWASELEALDQKSKKLKSLALSWKKALPRFAPFTGKIDSCYVDVKGDEFSEKNKNIFDIEIYKVKQIGDEQFQAELLFNLSDYDLKYPDKKQEALRTPEMDSKYKNLSSHDKNISCSEAQVYKQDAEKLLSTAKLLANIKTVQDHLERKKSVFNGID